MSFFKKATEAAKQLPKAAWVAAVIIPGGFTAVGIYVAVKALKKKSEEKTLKDMLKEWKND